VVFVAVAFIASQVRGMTLQLRGLQGASSCFTAAVACWLFLGEGLVGYAGCVLL